MVRTLLPLAALLLAGTARAGGFGIPEIGVRRTAMASIVGRPDDPSAVYHNPAGLVLEPGLQLYVSNGVSLLATEFSLMPWSDTVGPPDNQRTVASNDVLGAQPGANGYYAPVRPTRAFGVIPMIAATYELLPGKLWVGASVFVGNATGAKFDRNAVTRYHLIEGYIVAPEAVATVAYKVAPALSVGLTAGVIDMHVHGERLLYPVLGGNDISPIAGTKGDLTLDGTALAPTAILGLFGAPHPRVTWGATVTMRTDATLTGPVVVVESDDAAAPDTLKGQQSTSQLLPWAFMGGVNVDVTDQLELGSEFRYWLYRQYDVQDTKIKHIVLVDELKTQKNYGDSWEASGGVRVHDLAALPRTDLMMGLQYDHSPAPPETVTLDQPSFSHYGLHSGARYAWSRYRVGLSYIHYWYRVPTIGDSITMPPTNITGHGGNNIITASLEVRL